MQWTANSSSRHSLWPLIGSLGIEHGCSKRRDLNEKEKLSTPSLNCELFDVLPLYYYLLAKLIVILQVAEFPDASVAIKSWAQSRFQALWLVSCFKCSVPICWNLLCAPPCCNICYDRLAKRKLSKLVALNYCERCSWIVMKQRFIPLDVNLVWFCDKVRWRLTEINYRSLSIWNKMMF